jgi:fermentation-respiration switch protein FrsA (DUF1100 family)
MNNLLLLLAGFAAIILFLRWHEPRMIYFPDRDMEPAPAGVEDVWLTTADGVRIHGWWLPATNPAPLTVLFFHGNAGNISHRTEKLQIFRNLGANVLIIDYRGYGRSAGKPDEAGTYADARAAYDHLTKTLLVRRSLGEDGNREPRTVVVYGESLGSAVAVDLATKVPVGGVIIEEGFTSIGDVGQKMFPFLPVRWFVRNKYDSLAKINRINAPLLMFHSRQDEIFAWRHAERLLAAAREPKRLVELRGDHNNAFLVSADAYREGLCRFFQSLPVAQTVVHSLPIK